MSPAGLVSRYFDLFSEPLFTMHANGRERMFPFGVYSRGRIVPDAARGQKLRSQVKWTYAGLFLGIGVLSAPLGLWLGIGLGTLLEIAILLPLMFWRLHAISSDLELTDERLTLAAARQNQANKFGRPLLIALSVIGLLGAVGVLWLAYGSGAPQFVDPSMRVLLTGTAILFAFGAASGLASVMRKR